MGGSGGGSAPSAGGGGGGTTYTETGATKYIVENYLLNAVEDMLSSTDNTGLIPTAANNNPYEDAEPYDPTTPLKEVTDKFDEFDSMVTQVDELTLFRKFLTEAEKAIGKIDYDTGLYDDISGAYTDRLDTRYDTAKARFAAGAADVNAVQSSTFVIGMAMLDLQEQADADAFDAELGMRTTSVKANLLHLLIGQLMQLFGARTEMNLKSAEMFQEIKRQEIVALSDFEMKDLDIDTKSVAWPLAQYQYLANMMAGPVGGTTSTTTSHDNNTKYSGVAAPSKSLSAVSGALSGAAAGAVLAGPLGIGPGLAAGIGGVGGGLAGGLL